MKPNCNQCKHYFITFDQNAPKGCRAYQIKSKSLPSMVVKNANGGADCIGFEAKQKRNQNKSKVDLNDARYW